MFKGFLRTNCKLQLVHFIGSNEIFISIIYSNNGPVLVKFSKNTLIFLGARIVSRPWVVLPTRDSSVSSFILRIYKADFAQLKLTQQNIFKNIFCCFTDCDNSKIILKIPVIFIDVLDRIGQAVQETSL